MYILAFLLCKATFPNATVPTGMGFVSQIGSSRVSHLLQPCEQLVYANRVFSFSWKLWRLLARWRFLEQARGAMFACSRYLRLAGRRVHEDVGVNLNERQGRC